MTLNLMTLSCDSCLLGRSETVQREKKNFAASGNEVVFHGSVQLLWLNFLGPEMAGWAARSWFGFWQDQKARF
jgi:hypothetical protein